MVASKLGLGGHREQQPSVHPNTGVASQASPFVTHEVDGSATHEQNGEKGAEDGRCLVKHVQEDGEGERGKGATEPKNILHLECSRADRKAHQPVVLSHERRGCV